MSSTIPEPQKPKTYHLVFLKDGTNYVCQCKRTQDHSWRKNTVEA